MNSTHTLHGKPKTFKEKAKEEFVKAFQLTVYFGAWFCAIAFLAATSLDERPIPLSIFGFALIKAAVCAKFLLLAQAAFPIKVDKNHGIVSSLILESLIYLLVVLGLNYLEAGVHGLLHGKEFLISMTEFGQADPLRVVAMSIVYWLIVWPYLLLMGMTLMLGSNATLEILFGDKSKSSN
ncbi:hypothetical protein AOC19_04180 [Polynucleobacter asymbioticus]|jgi:hypothetical protein|uniref:hypothetical protein n=1 Tax=Polynucleobacter asymbioticus TaxID=576611 RepID=UPI001BFD576B|nr:hypothetical protein [Polynucleobacter asymbioticus]QWD86063.1 hypothetical protein AOC19_04180 [Polynucleobacter asymbioticus]